jgi:hypothetical protein
VALVTPVAFDDEGADVAHVLLSGILDKIWQIPAGGQDICFEQVAFGN